MRANKSPHKIHRKHFIMHSITGTTVFLAGIGADVFVNDFLSHFPHKAKFQNGTVEEHRTGDYSYLTNNITVEIGARDDGLMVWRIKR